MKILLLLITLLLSPIPTATAGDTLSPRKVLTLKEAYQKALAKNEAVAESEQAILQAFALYQETIRSAMPSFSYQYNTVWQDPVGLTAATEDPQAEGAFQFKKTGLTFYKEWVAARTGKAFIGQRQHEKQRVEQLLLSSVAGAYYGILEADENVATTRQLIDLAKKRLAELDARARVGRSRASDPLGAQFQLKLLEIQEQEALRLALAQRDLMAFLMGERVTLPLSASFRHTTNTRKLDDYIKQTESRADIQALRQAVEIARGALKIARSKDFPSLDIGANYYTNRPDAREAIDWDATLTVTVPLFAWGANRHAISAGKANVHKLEEAFGAGRRQAEFSVRDAYRNLMTARRKFALAEEGLSFAKQDYLLQSQDEEKGRVTSLEVLEALNRLNQAERTRADIRLQMRLFALNLELTAGTSSEEVLQ
jgi:outer membrane protein